MFAQGVERERKPGLNSPAFFFLSLSSLFLFRQKHTQGISTQKGPNQSRHSLGFLLALSFDQAPFYIFSPKKQSLKYIHTTTTTQYTEKIFLLSLCYYNTKTGTKETQASRAEQSKHIDTFSVLFRGVACRVYSSLFFCYKSNQQCKFVGYCEKQILETRGKISVVSQRIDKKHIYEYNGNDMSTDFYLSCLSL